MAGKIVADTLEHSTAGSVTTQYVVNGSAKAWSNFNGTGTIALRDSFNISSLTDNATGRHTTSYTNSLNNADYSLSGAGSKDVGESTSKFLIFDDDDTLTSSSTPIRIIQRSDDGEKDQTYVFTTIQGDLA